MNRSVTLLYDKQTIAISFVPPVPETKTPGVIQFELRGHRQQYIFTPAAWKINELAALERLFKIHYKKQGERIDQDLFADTAVDIVRGIMHIHYAYMCNGLDYAAYHLKHFPPTEDDTYDDIIMDAASHAMIDVDFFAGPKLLFDRVTLANEGKNLHAGYSSS